MIKLLFLMMFFFAGFYSLKADEAPGDDQKFKSELDDIKNPFEDGIPVPEPIVVVNEPKITYQAPKPIVSPMPKPQVLPMPTLIPKPEPVVWHPAAQEIAFPSLKLQGVMVGEDMHQAIINGQVVPLFGTIDGARVDSVSKEGVELSFSGKKVFLKVD